MSLAMIRKSKNPRAFKTISKNTLPVKYFLKKRLGWALRFSKTSFSMNLFPLQRSF